MLKNETYRHELKYQISMADYFAMRQRLRLVMKSDGHTREDGKYTIRSIYFDNSDDKVLREIITMIFHFSYWKKRSNGTVSAGK